jgi:hypothetical protein
MLVFSGNDEETHLPELASYSAHLNRRTFLRMPGMLDPTMNIFALGLILAAWITKDLQNGGVSFLRRYCDMQRIIPHPSLHPFFVTYGIGFSSKIVARTGPLIARSMTLLLGVPSVQKRTNDAEMRVQFAVPGAGTVPPLFGGNRVISCRITFLKSFQIATALLHLGNGIDGYDSPPIGNDVITSL